MKNRGDWEYELVSVNGNLKNDFFYVNVINGSRSGFYLLQVFENFGENSKNNNLEEKILEGEIRKENDFEKINLKEVKILENKKENNFDKIKISEAKKIFDKKKEINNNYILINHGWIPANLKSEFEKKNENIFSNKNNFNKEQKIIGLIKKSIHFEMNKSQLKTDLIDKNIPYINLLKLSNLYKIKTGKKINKIFYLEKFISDEEKIDSIYPVASNRNNYQKPYLTPDKHRSYSIFWGSCTLIGIYFINFGLSL